MKKIYYGQANYNSKEIKACLNVLNNQSLSLMTGKNVSKLEKKIAKIFGKKYALMVNSGSSANLLAIQSLNLKKKYEVITPTLTFSTTISPIYQSGLMPNFVDVEKRTFVVDIKQIENQINLNTRIIMIPNLIGNIANWHEIKKIADKYNLITIEDSADTIGYSLNGVNTGKLSDITTNSFYASHIVSGAGFGGIVCFNSKKLYLRAKLLRGWGRSSALFNEDEDFKKRFGKKLNGIKYDSKYIFEDFGYNFLPSEISAAFALEQLKKLKQNLKIRNKNFLHLLKFFEKNKNFFEVPLTNKNIKTGWLAFPLLIKKNKFFDRTDLQIFLEKNKIQTRTIFTGNILKQPIMKNQKYKKHKNSEINSTDIMTRGMLLGCHQGLGKNELNYIINTIKKFIKNIK
jgi:CDP-6-deoxy-D-xylo-4-hexulose-3-dehydrase